MTTQHDVPGNPYFYVVRQAIYAVVGIALMLAVARIDYSRFRELRVGIYTAMIGLIILVLVLGEATRGSRRWIELPFFTFQPSELGKVLLIVALAAFVIDRSRRMSERQRTVRMLALGLVPAALVFLQPDLGTALVYARDHARGAVRRRACAGRTSPRSAGLRRAAVAIVLVIAPAVGTPDPRGLPAGAPHVVPATRARTRAIPAIRSIRR